jgi:16S rRNA (uracil1498-N3)-methyltransferase
MRRRFFVDRFQNGRAVLQGEPAHHLARVLRAEPGQLYELSDGEAVWLARTQEIGRDSVEFALVERLPVLLTRLHVTLLLAIVKFDRFEWAIEKATELGADEVVPLAAERSEKGLIAAAAKRAARWKKILVESAQQSRRLRVPVLQDATTPGEGFRTDNSQLRVLLSERAGAKPMRQILDPVSPSGQNSAGAGSTFTLNASSEAWSPPEPGAGSTFTLNASSEAWSPPEPGAGSTWSPPENVVKLAIAIGPEGGWTEAEFIIAAKYGFAEAALGINILRTETAVCAALAAAQYAFGVSRQEASSSDSRPNALSGESETARAVGEKGSRESSNE